MVVNKLGDITCLDRGGAVKTGRYIGNGKAAEHRTVAPFTHTTYVICGNKFTGLDAHYNKISSSNYFVQMFFSAPHDASRRRNTEQNILFYYSVNAS